MSFPKFLSTLQKCGIRLVQTSRRPRLSLWGIVVIGMGLGEGMAPAIASPVARGIVERSLVLPTAVLEAVAQTLLETTEQEVGQAVTAQAQPGSPEIDPELGELRLQERELQITPPELPAAPSTVFLSGRVDYFRSDNLFSSIDPIDDSLLRYGLTLWAAPALGPQTYWVTTLEGNLIRYLNRPQFNYNAVNVGTGIYQQLTPQMSGEVGWNYQALFSDAQGQQFYSDHTLQVQLNRQDALAERLNLNSSYQLAWSLANPSDRSRVTNALNASLVYDLEPALQTALDYQVVLNSFTQQARTDHYQQINARLTYLLSPTSRINAFGGWSFGSSSNPNVNFNGAVLGVNVVFNLGL